MLDRIKTYYDSEIFAQIDMRDSIKVTCKRTKYSANFCIYEEIVPLLIP